MLGRGGVTPPLLAAGLALLVAVAVFAIALGADLENLPINLSKRAEIGLKSADVNVEASADGEWVAAVWSRGYDAQPDTAQVGYIVLKSANVATGWEKQVNVFTPTATVWAQQPRLAFPAPPADQTQLSIVWVECQNEDENCNTIRVATCDLSSLPDTCESAQLVHSQSSANLSKPDVAYDESGVRHYIWKEGSGAPDPGIYYKRHGGTASKVDATTIQSVNPSLAWTNDQGGRLHLVWYEYNDEPESRRIKYSADTTLTDNSWDNSPWCQWKANASYEFTGGDRPYIRPSIAASGASVFIAWDMYKYIDYEDRFHLVYQRSYNNGVTWGDTCSGYGLPVPGTYFDDANTYRSPLSSIAEESTLRPSIALNDDAPAIAWHLQEKPGGENDVYVVGYVSSVKNGDDIAWNAPVLITQHIDHDPNDGISEDDSANPGLAFWHGGRLHLAHMGLWGGDPFDETSDWDIYYRGYVVTDLSSSPTPTPEPGSTGEPTSVPTATLTPTPTRTYTPTPPRTPVSTPTYTPTPTDTRTPTTAPQPGDPSPTSTATPTDTTTPTPTYTPTRTPGGTPTRTPTSTPTYTPSSTRRPGDPTPTLPPDPYDDLLRLRLPVMLRAS